MSDPGLHHNDSLPEDPADSDFPKVIEFLPLRSACNQCLRWGMLQSMGVTQGTSGVLRVVLNVKWLCPARVAQAACQPRVLN